MEAGFRFFGYSLNFGFANQCEFADLALQRRNHFLGCARADPPEPFELLQIIGFDGIGDIADRQREGFDRFKRADGFH